MASIADLYIDAGTSYSTVINVTGDDGFPLDMENLEIKAQLRRHNYSATAIDFITQIVGPGQITLNLPAETTELLKNSRYLYDVIITDPNGVVTRVVEGIVFVNPQVTKRIVPLVIGG
jgi:hypothetical protein